jgi:hypothetical protein
MKHNELMSIPLGQFGLPDVRKFPMPDEKRLKAAVAYFHTADEKDRKELASNIVRRHKQLGSDLKVSKKNPLWKYVPEKMRMINESTELISLRTLSYISPLLNEEAMLNLESLMVRDGLNDVDDMDSAIPDDYKGKLKLLGTLKSFIINEDIPDSEYDGYTLAYDDFPVPTSNLRINNGGLNECVTSPLLKYNGAVNEASHIGPATNIQHIQFCSLLREWNELYVQGVRNPGYDRLMIESWKTYSDFLQESFDASRSLEDAQKLLDLGFKTDELYKVIQDSNLNDKYDEILGDCDLPSMDYSNPSSTIFAKDIKATLIDKGVRHIDTSYFDGTYN